jgi:hypothetical protein
MILEFTTAELTPDRGSILGALGVPGNREVPPSVQEALTLAEGLFQETAAPRGLVAEVTPGAFGDVYAGEGMNAPDSIVGQVFPRAKVLALFAVTLGEATSQVIGEGFESHNYPVAAILDALASEAADRAADGVERRLEELWKEEGRLSRDGAALRYSPGYCGWDITGQRALFRHLDPQRIGIALSDACLMQPLKSVSGVILAGPRTIHRFSPTYPFCRHCQSRGCLERMRALFSAPGRAHRNQSITNPDPGRPDASGTSGGRPLSGYPPREPIP